jgi:DUF4097 and DUF4098 domain-containing protein YvlB
VLLATFAALLLSVQASDTTLTVQRGERLNVSVHGGDIVIRAWNRNSVSVRMADSDAELGLSRSRGGIRISPSGRHGEPMQADLTISVPAWMPVTLDAIESDITVSGTQAPVSITTVQGDIDVTGGDGIVSLTSVEGSVSLRGSRGRFDLESVNDDVVVIDSRGDVKAETVNGDIRLEGIEAADVEGGTVNGDIVYYGTIEQTGRYHFGTHNGDITMSVPENAGAVVSVSTFGGEFESAFPVRVSGTRGRNFSFTLGSGSAKIELESFQGTIRLERPGIRTRTRSGTGSSKSSTTR